MSTQNSRILSITQSPLTHQPAAASGFASFKSLELIESVSINN
jgi:hypothetical protein